MAENADEMWPEGRDIASGIPGLRGEEDEIELEPNAAIASAIKSRSRGND